MGIIEDLTQQELATIDKFRDRLKDVLNPKTCNTTLLYRFLKARDFNLDQAESMFRKNLEWRKINRVDYIIKEFKAPEVLTKYMTPSFIGFDKEGCPVRYLALGNIDNKGLAKSAKFSDAMKNVIQIMELEQLLMEKQSEKLGEQIFQLVYIYNLENFTIAKATDKLAIELFLNMTRLNQDNYPERIKSIIVINAPAYYKVPFSILKSIMAIGLIRKIHIFGYDGWKEALLKLIDADVLPAFLGGRRTDPDGNPMCNTFIHHGGLVPQEYYITKGVKTLLHMPDVTKVLIPSRSKHEVRMDVEKPGSVIEWEFETENHDIGFGLYYEKYCEEVELLPISKIDTSEGTEKGMCNCENRGIYVIVFDNTYSWFYSKQVYYRTSITDPNDSNGYTEE